MNNKTIFAETDKIDFKCVCPHGEEEKKSVYSFPMFGFRLICAIVKMTCSL